MTPEARPAAARTPVPAASPGVRREARPRRARLEYARAVAVVAAATGAASLARSALQIPDVEMLFLLGVVVVAVTSGRGPSVAASVLSVAAYDFFFVPPPLTFDVDDARYVLTFAMMLGVAVVISSLTLRVREQERAAAQRERRTSALYAVSRRLGAALAAPDVAAACVDAIADVVGTASAFLLAAAGRLTPAATSRSVALSTDELEVATWASLHGSAAGRGTGTFEEAPILCIPLRPVVNVLAVLAIRAPAGGALRDDHRDFSDALCRQAALALERIRLADEARSAALRAETEALRSALLSSVSHDLRTPLAAITGAATTLRGDVALDAQTRRELVESICEEAERLERLVGNLLDMTRLESGAVQPRREWVPLIEVVGGALGRLDRELAGREVETGIPDDLPLVSADPVLLEQLLLNLLDNAAKHTPRGTPISISASPQDGGVVVEVADRGGGVPEGAEEQVFERFRRGAGAGRGVGLGLAIARAIAVAHGGALVASRRPGGGAVFRLSIPAGAPPPSGTGEPS
jgi:two-component system sensor histidine kinase KdpD